MKLTIDIDLATDSREQIAMVANLLNNVTNAARRPTSTQPQVVENSGSTGSAPTFTPSDDAVVGADVAGEQPEDKSAPTDVSEDTQSSAPAAESSTVLTLDDVRAALQGFTAANGVPAGIELLKEFGATRISELKAEQFAAFMGKCSV